MARSILLIALGMSLICSYGVMAETASPAPINLTLTPDQMRVVANALSERPYREVAALIAELQRQIAEQQKPTAEPAK